jgi:hypothetical protein
MMPPRALRPYFVHEDSRYACFTNTRYFVSEPVTGAPVESTGTFARSASSVSRVARCGLSFDLAMRYARSSPNSLYPSADSGSM